MKPIVVFSGVNFTEGGPLSIYKDAIGSFVKHHIANYSLIVIVHSKELFMEFNDSGINFIEKKSVKNSYLRRLWFEYYQSYFLSKKLKPYLWFSLHDVTPNVVSVKRVVYCHNPAPFYKVTWREARIEPTFLFFTLFYFFLYQINIKANDYVIVQQNWIRMYFTKKFKLESVIVAYPDISIPIENFKKPVVKNQNFVFFYPAFPRVFKNFETLLDAVNILSASRLDFNVVLTITGNENLYAKQLKKRYGHLGNITFVGILKREDVLTLYNSVDCLVFPSKLETWGLPISEFKFFDKPMLVADELYSRETVGNYQKVKFFEPDNPRILSSYMNELMSGTLKYSNNHFSNPEEPFTSNWKDLFDKLLS